MIMALALGSTEAKLGTLDEPQLTLPSKPRGVLATFPHLGIQEQSLGQLIAPLFHPCRFMPRASC